MCYSFLLHVVYDAEVMSAPATFYRVCSPELRWNMSWTICAESGRYERRDWYVIAILSKASLTHIRQNSSLQEETRRRAVLYNQARDPSTILLALFLLFLLGSYNLGIDRNISNLIDFFLRGDFHACALKEGLMCTLLKFVLLFLYPVLLGWLVWVVKLEKVWRDHQEWVVFAGMVVGFVAMVHYEVPKALGMRY